MLISYISQVTVSYLFYYQYISTAVSNLCSGLLLTESECPNALDAGFNKSIGQSDELWIQTLHFRICYCF